MRKQTILHTIETSEPGGAETILLRLASNLDRDRFRSLALLPEEGWLSEQLRNAGVPVFFANSRKWYDFRLLKDMSRLIEQEGVDLIHSQQTGQNFYSCIAGLLKARKTVATYQAAHDLAEAQGWKDTARLATVRMLADAVVAVSEDVSALLKRAHFPPKKIVRIYNAIDAKGFSVKADGRLRRSLDLPEHSRLVGTVACLRPQKGYTFLIEAARAVIDSIPEVHFIAAGEMNAETSRPLFELVDQLGLRNHFHFLGFRDDIPEILSELDVFVLASTSEGLPLALLEAMAAGRPVVATQCGGPAEVVQNGVNGLLIPPGEPKAIASAVTELLTNRDRAARFAQAGRAKTQADFTLDKMLEDHEALYERLLSEA